MELLNTSLRTFLKFMAGDASTSVTDMNGRVWTGAQFKSRKAVPPTTYTMLPEFDATCPPSSPVHYSADTVFTLDVATINAQTPCP